MRKFLLACLCLCQCLGALADNKKSAPTYEATAQTKAPLFSADWVYRFKKMEHLFDQQLEEIDTSDSADFKQRYQRMLHAAHLNDEEIAHHLKRIQDFAENTPDLIAYIENYFIENYQEAITVKHISIYGSFLYNKTDPDDVDLLLVVDSAKPIFEHLEFPFTKINASPEKSHFPKVSFQVIDFDTFTSAQKNKKGQNLSRAERIAQQQLTVAGSWYFTIYGFDLRFDNPLHLNKRMKLNYLHKAFNTLNAAGSRLFLTAYTVLPPETERIRLRKVVSRLLITDFLLPALTNKAIDSTKYYQELYEEIRNIQDEDSAAWLAMQKKIETIYLEKLSLLLQLTEKFSKIDQLKVEE